MSPEGCSKSPIPVPRDFLLLIALLMALLGMAVDLPLPAFPFIREAYGLPEDSTLVGQSITYFFLGMALPQAAYGPISDRFGRRPVLFFGLAVYVFSSVAAALSPNLSLLLASRFLWGVGAAASRVVVVALVRDCYSGAQMARFMSLVFALFVMVPVFAPSLGSLLMMVAPWPVVYWFSTAFALLIAVWVYFRLPETLPPQRRLPLRLGPVTRAVGRVLTTRVTALNTLASTLLLTSFTSYIASSELIVSEVFDRKDQFPIIFGLGASAAGVGSLLNGRLVTRLGLGAVLKGGLVWYLSCAGLLLATALWGNGRPSFWVWYPLLGGVLLGNMLLFPNLNTIALGPLGEIAGTASSVTGALSTALSAALAAVVDSIMEGSVVPLSAAFFGGGLLAAGLVVLSRAQSVLDSAEEAQVE